jgi:MoaA/NifB/PqqE/SkfB family radical SAM enzyme
MSDKGKLKPGYTGPLNKSLRIFFTNAVRITLRSPSQAYLFFRTVWWQRKAARVRQRMAEEGIQVPPIIIYSITDRCNLHCKGCYAQTLHKSLQPEMDDVKMKETIREARELGVSFMILAGGEPLVRREILDVIAAFPDVIFLVFTNGTLIDDELADAIKKRRNLVPILSLEGGRTETDLRRGSGIFQNLTGVIGRLNRRHIFFGTSITLTSLNFVTITDDSFIKDLYDLGDRLFFFIEYTPVDSATEAWEINSEQRNIMTGKAAAFRKRFPALFINLPDDEKDFGGCLSAGRGFVHISSQGDIEPCPFAPYSDTNLRETSLKEALKSRFLAAVRENSDKLEEGKGGCALWSHREWLSTTLARLKQPESNPADFPGREHRPGNIDTPG